MNKFLNNVENLRKNKGLSQKEFAKSLGISPQTLNSWLRRNTVPAADIACDIAQYFGVTVEMLVTGTGQNAASRISNEVLELAEDIFRLPVEYQEIIRQNVESYKKLCFKLEEESTQGIG